MPLNNPTGSPQWTVEQCDELRRLAEEGKSYRAIATEINRKFGTSYTRNASIGKAMRMGLAKPAAPSVPGNRKPRKRSLAEFGTERKIKRKYESTRIQRANGNSGAMRIIKTFTTDQTALRCVEIKCEIPFADVTGCRYTDGDGPFLFCNGKQRDNSSYCEPHFWLCRGEPRPRRATAFVGIAA